MIRVRTATPADEQAVFVLATDLATSAHVHRDAFVSIFTELVADPDGLLAVAVTSDRVIGYLTAHAHRSFHANGDVVWVDELMVDEPVRHLGAGRALMRLVEQWSSTRGAVQITLATRRAAAFYSAIGYSGSATFFSRDVPREST